MSLDTTDLSSSDPLPADDHPAAGVDAPDLRWFVFALCYTASMRDGRPAPAAEAQATGATWDSSFACYFARPR